MESLLLQIIKDSSNSKYTNVKTTSQEAYDFLEQQQGNMRAYPYEMREKCLSCFQLALESHNSKLRSHAVSGMQRILRDNRFHSEMGCTMEDQWLSMQLLRTVTSVCSQPTEIQVEILKVVLNMTCSNWWNTSSNGLLRLLQVCEDVFTEGNSAAVETAAQAAAGQALRTFCAHLQEEDELQCANSNAGCDNEKVQSVFDEVVPLLIEVCKKLNSRYTQGKIQPGLSFHIQTVLSLLSYLPVSSRKSKLFLDFMWQQLCPALLALLGSPYADKMERIKPFGSADHVGDQGKSATLSSADVKTLYHISIELVRLVGTVASLRPMLESVFHRLCVCTHYQHRLEAVRSTRELLSKSARLLDFAGPPLVRDKLSAPPNDLNLIMLTMELLVNGCHSSNSNICYASVDGVVALLMTLRKLCEGDDLSEEYVTVLNDMFKDLASCDYTGPITYSLWEKLCQQDFPVEEIPKSTEIEKSSINATSECEQSHTCSEMHTEVALDAGEYLRNEGNDGLDNTDGKIENVSKGFDTDSSGSTEGPEDDEERELQENLQMAQAASEAEISRRLQIVPKTLLQKDENAANLERVVRQFSSRDEFAQIERQNARHFVQVLEDFLPKLLLIRSSIEADEALQEFASNYCQEITSPRDGKGCLIIINADGVYLATYQVLLLNLKLIHSKYYENGSVDPPLTEDEFIESIHGSGVLVYLCATWLAELYQLILARNLLEMAGFKLTADVPSLVNLLMDLDGLGSNNQGSQLLSDCRRLEQALTNQDTSPAVDAGRKLSRRLLTATWDAIMEVLSVLLTGCNSLGVTSTVGLLLGTEGAREEHRRAREAIVTCLEGLQIAAQLSNILGLQSRCGAVFSLLAKVCCPSLAMTAATSGHKKLKTSMIPGRNKSPRLHTSHVLSMELILGSGLELASHCPDCWTHVFRCCVYVGELEHVCFSKGQHHLALAKIQRKRDTDVSTGQMDDYIFEPPSLPVKLPTPAVDVKETIRESLSDLSLDGVLGPEKTLVVLCGLSQLVDKLFEEAACKLNLQALMNFLNELCAASQAQLFANKATRTKAKVRNGSWADDGRREGVLLLHGLGDAMLRCVRSGRPLMHIMLAWSVAGPHFMEAACHKDSSVSKKAVACIHDTLMALLGSQPELAHFHFNEALFKPFENLLSLELCDADVQDEIVSAICEFVEGNRGEIRSGWRPLFGALRAVRAIPHLTVKAPSNGNGNGNSNFMSRGHVRAVLDVFEAFFRTDNALVFANASVDFILCLLKHIQGKDLAEIERGESTDGEVRDGVQPTVDLCLASLQCINQCCSILTSMHRMTSCPIFHTASRIQANTVQQLVDFSPSISKLHRFGASCTQDVDDGLICEETTEPSGCPNTLEELDEPSGILHVWWLILDGLATAATSADHHYQPHVAEALFTLLRNTLDVPGPEFAVFVVNRLCLPWLQSWLRRSAKVCRGWDNFSSSFKQCCGQTCDLVVDFISRIAETNGLDSVGGVELMLRQLLAILVECVCEPTESIARLGASCIRHVIVSAGHVLTAPLWEVACWGLCRANDVTLFALRQLTAAFRPNSETSSGDLARVRVAAVRDSSPGDHQRLTQLAIQVFLLDCQDEDSYQGPRCRSDAEEFQDDDRSYIFLLCAPEPEESSCNSNGNSQIVKVSLRSVVVGLAVHQIVLQTLGAVLLQGVHHVVPSLANVLLMSPAPTPSAQAPQTETALTPGMLSRLSEKQLNRLLGALQRSFEAAWDFDDRPGLKFLVQKVCLAGTGSGTRSFGTANLFRQAGASWTLRTVVLMEMCIHTVLKDEKRFLQHSSNLKDSLNEFSKRYAELQAKKAKIEPGSRDSLQHAQEQPLFFLAVQPDLLPLNQVDGQLLQTTTTPVADTANIPTYDPQDDDSQAEEAHEVKVYSVATQNDVDALVEEYKRRKQQHAPPSGATSSWSQRRSVDRSPSTDDDHNDDQDDDDLPLPRICPAVKDVQLQARVWAEAALAAFDLLCQLDDEHIKALLGVVFPFVRSLVAHAGDSTLRQTVAEFLDRVACLHGFSVS